MHLTVLGSGTNVHPRRAAAGYLIETDQSFLLDFGPGTLRHLMQTGVDRHQIRYLLFSHYHADHFSDFITSFFDAVFHSRRVGPRPDLTIIGPKGTRRLFRAILKTFPAFDAGRFRVTLREVADQHIRIGETQIAVRTVRHSPRLNCVGYRISWEGRHLAYSGDSQYCPSLVELCRETDLAILDCSFPANQPGMGHMHAGDCGRVAREAETKHLLLSHFYPLADRYDVKRQAGRQYDGRITKAKDLMAIPL